MRNAWTGFVTALLFIPGCSRNQRPELLPLEPQTAVVSSRFELKLVASDPDGDALIYTVESPTLDLKKRYRLVALGNEAIFTWTPLAADVGQHQMDFSVSDGEETDLETVVVTVKPSGGNTAPVFRKPLNTATVIDLAKQKCIDLDILVEDPDSVKVTIRQDPEIPGSVLTAGADGFSAGFHWCPTTDQANKVRWVLKLLADDGENEPTPFNFEMVIISDIPVSCPGDAPVIEHTSPGAQTTADDISVTAKITDDKGLKSAPVVYTTTTAPTDPTKLDYTKMTPVTMTETAAGSHQYTAKLPNPTAGVSGGQTRTLYYAIVAEDNDDGSGSCHRTQLPAKDVFSVAVTRPSGTACTSNAQCPKGQVCDGKLCVADSCVPTDTNSDQFYWEQSTCPTGHFCPTKGPSVSPSHCVASCIIDSDCKRAGDRCKVFDTKPGCAPEGTKNIGTGCSDFTECKGIAMCLPWKGGYCSISDCDSLGYFSGPCPSGSVCVDLPDARFKTSQKHYLCLKLCSSDSVCRTSQQYSCKAVTDDMGTSQKVCLQ